MSTAMHEAAGELARPDLYLVADGAGQIAAAEAVEAPQDSYKYEVVYGDDGSIAGGRSWRYDAEMGETTFTRFDAQGNQLGRYLTNEPLGMQLEYDGKDNLVFSSHQYDGGKVLERYWYGDNGLPKSSVHIDKIANTHTMTIYQPGIGDWVKTTPYAGSEGWVS